MLTASRIIKKQVKMNYLNKENIEHIAVGASVLASGGGGDPHIGKLMALNALKQYGSITLLSVDELEPDALIVSTGTIGATMVSFEKLANGEESVTACRLIEKYLNRKISAIYPIEIGGINSLWPLVTAARLGVPLVDVDAMGRAFPEYHMTTLSLGTVSASPLAIVDAKLNISLIQTQDNHITEKLARSLCAEMGGTAFLAAYPISPNDAKKSGILGTLSFAQQIGETIERARNTKANIVQTLAALLRGFVLFHGKITKVDQRTVGGFTRGVVYFAGTDKDNGKTFEIFFQNEYLLARSAESTLCTTPDLITLLDEETGTPILTERLRYGIRVVVLGIPANEKWRTARGIEVAGPGYFNYGIDYIPLEERVTSSTRA